MPGTPNTMNHGVNSNSIDTLLDNIFAGGEINDLVPNETSPVWDEISKAPAENMNQKGGFYLVQIGSTNSAQDSQFFDSEDEDFPLPTSSKYMRLEVQPIVTRATVQVTDHAELQDKSKFKEMPAKNVDYLVNDIDGEMRFVDLKRSRQIWGNRSNEVARISAINYTTRVITCNNAGNMFGVRNIEQGSRLEIRDNSDVLRADAGLSPYIRIESVNRSLRQLKYQDNTVPAAGVVDGDKLFGFGDCNNGWAGIDYHTGTTGPWQGVADRTIHDRLRGIRIDAGGASLHAALLRKMVSAQRNRIDQNKTRSKLKFFASAQLDVYEASGFAQQGYGQSGDELKRGFTKLSFSGIPFVYDRFVPFDSIFLGTMNKLQKFEMQNFGPVKDGTTYLRRLPGKNGQSWSPKKQIIFQGIGNTGTNDPAGLGVWLTNLSTANVSLADD